MNNRREVDVIQPTSSHSVSSPLKIDQEIRRDNRALNGDINNDSTPRNRRLERSPRRSDHFDRLANDEAQTTPKAGSGTHASIGSNTKYTDHSIRTHTSAVDPPVQDTIKMRANPELSARLTRGSVKAKSRSPSPHKRRGTSPIVASDVAGSAPESSPEARTMVATPASPPPSPLAGSSAALKASAESESVEEATPVPTLTIVEGTEKASTSPILPSARGTSTLASLLHATNQDGPDSTATISTEAKEVPAQVNTPPSPDSLPQGNHSRNISMADISIASRDSPTKESREDESMDVDPPSSNATNTARTHPGLAPLLTEGGRVSSRSPQPPTAPPSAHGPSSAPLLRSQPSPIPSTPASGQPLQTYRTHNVSHQRRHSLTQVSYPHSRSRNAADTPISHSQPVPSAVPQALSPSSQLSAFRTEGSYERDGPADSDPIHIVEHQKALIDDLQSQLLRQRKLAEQRDDELHRLEMERASWMERISAWLRDGERLLLEAGATTYDVKSQSAPPSAYIGRGVHSGSTLSSVLASAHAASRRELGRALEKDRTLSAVSPASPYPPSRLNPSYADPRHGPRSIESPRTEYPPHLSRNPSYNDALLRSMHRSTPSLESTGHGSLRRARKPSTDDLAHLAGSAKRMKTDSGDFVRVSSEVGGGNGPVDRISDARHNHESLAASAPLPMRQLSGHTQPPGFEKGSANPGGHLPRGSNSLGNGMERGRDSPLDRRVADGDDEEFPSPRHQHANPSATTPVIVGNGYGAGAMKPSPLRDSRVAGVDRETGELEAHKTLMELGEDDERDSARLRRGHAMRNGSRSSMNSQDVDDLLAEVAGDESDQHRSSRSHYRGLPPGADARTYTQSSRPSARFTSSSVNSRSYVFRNTEPGDMETQTYPRSPEEMGHRSTHSGSFIGRPGSPGPHGHQVTPQFLPPQSGPPMPKKIYHTKATGQTLGAHNIANAMSAGVVDPSFIAPRTGLNGAALTPEGFPKRTCKQCGQPGRYKDNKCVEKWGPGPKGPGTVCDRCRKKMKREEKRATQDSLANAAAAAAAPVASYHQYPIAPAPSGSFSQHASQASQRLDESNEYGYSQATDDLQNQPSLSRAGSQNHISRPTSHSRGSYAPESLVRRESTLPYQPQQPTAPTSNARDAMMPPTSTQASTYASPESGRSEHRRRQSSAGDPDYSAAPSSRDGEVDADGDAEMDELDEEVNAAADASITASQRSRET